MPFKLPNFPLDFEAISADVDEYGARNWPNSSSFGLFGDSRYINTPCDPMKELERLTNRIPYSGISSVLTTVASQAPLLFANRFRFAQIHISDINPRQLESTWGDNYFNRPDNKRFTRTICDLANPDEFWEICEELNPDVFFGSNILDFTKEHEEMNMAKVLLKKIHNRIPYVLLTGGRYSGTEFHKEMINNGYNYEAIPGKKLWEARAYTLNNYCQQILHAI